LRDELFGRMAGVAYATFANLEGEETIQLTRLAKQRSLVDIFLPASALFHSVLEAIC
jgi:hypothetical protein